MTSRPVPIPPGRPHVPRARRVLVLAPHFDDEVLGCGGLLARLARPEAEGGAGASVRIAFSSNGSPDDDPGYAARRRAEAEKAVAVLGLGDAAILEDAVLGGPPLPDGRLSHHLDELAERIDRALAVVEPDLLLVPSPLEASADHRAVFAALHRCLAPVRRSDPLVERSVRDLRILTYEVNHALYPDVLVDVSAEISVLERAMAAYASQQERHDYLRSSLGRRAFRAISLPPEVEAVEAYRGLRLEDFTTRGPAALVEHLGGAPRLAATEDGPLVSVIVRTKDRPELLAEALGSIARSTYRRLELVLVNDGGERPEIPADFPFPSRLVDLRPGRGRAGAANAGVEAARGRFVAFLDDDDRVEPEHYATLVGAVSAAGVRVVYTDAAVVVHELGEDGWAETERRLPYSRDFDPDLLLLDNYLPFHTLLVERRLFAEIEAPAGEKDTGPFDPSLPFFEDWDFLIRLAARTPFHHVARATCEYRQFRGGGHHVLGDRPRERADFLAMKGKILARHRHRVEPPRLARVVDALRAETVAAEEDVRHLRERLAESEEAWHRLRGTLRAAEDRRQQLEAVAEQARADRDAERAARGEAEQRGAALERQVDELETFQRGKGEELGRAYEEIGRLTELVRSMRSTRAWRWHERAQRLLGRSGSGSSGQGS